MLKSASSTSGAVGPASYWRTTTLPFSKGQQLSLNIYIHSFTFIIKIRRGSYEELQTSCSFKRSHFQGVFRSSLLYWRSADTLECHQSRPSKKSGLERRLERELKKEWCAESAMSSPAWDSIPLVVFTSSSSRMQCHGWRCTRGSKYLHNVAHSASTFALTHARSDCTPEHIESA